MTNDTRDCRFINDSANAYNGREVIVREISRWGAGDGVTLVCKVEMMSSPGLSTHVRGEHLSPPVTPRRFKWKCSWLGHVSYEVRDDSGVWEITVRRSFSEYHRLACRPETRDYEAGQIDVLSMGASDCPPSLDLLREFNAWLADDHAGQIAFIRSHPERYGEITQPTPQRAACIAARAPAAPSRPMGATGGGCSRMGNSSRSDERPIARRSGKEGRSRLAAPRSGGGSLEPPHDRRSPRISRRIFCPFGGEVLGRVLAKWPAMSGMAKAA